MRTAAPVAFDSPRLLRSLYRLDDRRIGTLYGLSDARMQPSIAAFSSVISRLTPFVNTGFEAPIRDSVVVGGGCLGYSGADLTRLRLDYLSDTLHAVAFARWAGLRSLIYLPIGEEMITATAAAREGWRRFGDEIEALVTRLINTVDGDSKVTVIRTDQPSVRAVLARSVDTSRPHLDDGDLSKLYSIRPSGSVVQPGESRLAQYRATISTYLPTTVAQLVGVDCVTHVIAVENLHQVRAIAVARQLAESVATVSHLAHVPAPSLTGSTRMSVAQPKDAIFVRDEPAAMATRLRRSPKHVQDYWRSTFAMHRSVSSVVPDTTAGALSLYFDLASGVSS